MAALGPGGKGYGESIKRFPMPVVEYTDETGEFYAKDDVEEYEEKYQDTGENPELRDWISNLKGERKQYQKFTDSIAEVTHTLNQRFYKIKKDNDQILIGKEKEETPAARKGYLAVKVPPTTMELEVTEEKSPRAAPSQVRKPVYSKKPDSRPKPIGPPYSNIPAVSRYRTLDTSPHVGTIPHMKPFFPKKAVVPVLAKTRRKVALEDNHDRMMHSLNADMCQYMLGDPSPVFMAKALRPTTNTATSSSLRTKTGKSQRVVEFMNTDFIKEINVNVPNRSNTVSQQTNSSREHEFNREEDEVGDVSADPAPHEASQGAPEEAAPAVHTNPDVHTPSAQFGPQP